MKGCSVYWTEGWMDYTLCVYIPFYAVKLCRGCWLARKDLSVKIECTPKRIAGAEMR